LGPGAHPCAFVGKIGKKGLTHTIKTDDTLVIVGGGEVSNSDADIGFYGSGVGTATVDGVGSTWTNSGVVNLGFIGEGTLNVLNGGAVSSRSGLLGYGGGGTVTVDGAGSEWTNERGVTVGEYGSGELNVLGGGYVLNDTGLIGAGFGGSGTATVDGVDSLWCNTDSLYVGGGSTGPAGTGQLNVRNGGVVDAGDLLKVWGPGTVSLTGGEIVVGGAGVDIDGRLTIGSDAAGEVSVVGSGDMSSVTSCLGYEEAGVGTVTVAGAGSTWTNSGYLYVGGEGRGELKVTDGGELASGNAIIGDLTDSLGAATISGSGSTWTNAGELYVGYDGVGSLNVVGSATVSNTYCYIGAYEDSSGSVTVDGPGSTWTNFGEFYVGQESQGTLDIFNGGLVRIADELTIGDNDEADSSVRMGAGGMLALHGQGDDSLGDFLDLIAGTDAINYWDQSAWGWVDITSATDGVDYTLEFHTSGALNGYTVLTVIAVTADMLGDTNADYLVDDADYDNLVAQFGGPPGEESADFNRDGVVGLADFAVMRAHFGSGLASAPAAGLAVSAPEPTTLIMLAAGAGFLKRRRLRR